MRLTAVLLSLSILLGGCAAVLRGSPEPAAPAAEPATEEARTAEVRPTPTPKQKPPPPRKPRLLRSVPALIKALRRGQTVRVVIDYEVCQLEVDGELGPGVDAIGGFEIGTWEYFAPMLFGNPQGFLAASEAVLIHHPAYGVIHNYAKLRVFDDGKVQVTVKYLDAETFEIAMEETFLGALEDGRNKGGVRFYVDG